MRACVCVCVCGGGGGGNQCMRQMEIIIIKGIPRDETLLICHLMTRINLF